MSSVKLFRSDMKITNTLKVLLKGTISHLPVNKYNQREHALNIFGNKAAGGFKILHLLCEINVVWVCLWGLVGRSSAPAL